MGALQPWHLIVILVIVLVVFGPGKLPELGKALGEGMRELKRATKDENAAPATTTATAGATTATPAAPAPVAPAPAAPATNGATATMVAPASVAVATAETKCSRCQTAVAPGTRFCGSCGAPLTA